MGLKIQSNTLIENRYLKVQPDGVIFCQTAFVGGTRCFGFHQIQTVLLSGTNVLSIQVGNEVFSLPVKPYKRHHMEVTETLVREVKLAHDQAV